MPVTVAPDVGPAKDRDDGVDGTFKKDSSQSDPSHPAEFPAIRRYRSQVDACASLRHSLFNVELGVEDRLCGVDIVQPLWVCIREDRRNEFKAVCLLNISILLLVYRTKRGVWILTYI